MTTKYQLIFGIVIFFLSLSGVAYKLNIDYKINKKLTFAGTLALLYLFVLQGWLAATAIFIPAGFVQNQVLLTLGIFLMLIGLFFLFMAIRQMNNYKTFFGYNDAVFYSTKIYSLSRHPQYTGYVIFQSGAAMAWWNHYAIVAIITAMILVYVMVFLEERHLIRVFGHQYDDFRKQVRRFL
jgi:methanethiol S-methyltransferase